MATRKFETIEDRERELAKVKRSILKERKQKLKERIMFYSEANFKKHKVN